jgi:hypothetical protein
MLPDSPTLCGKVERLSVLLSTVQGSVCTFLPILVAGWVFFDRKADRKRLGKKIKNNLIADKAFSVNIPVARYCESCNYFIVVFSHWTGNILII